MVDYKTMKAALKQERGNIKYFTEDFYATFISEKRMSFDHFIKTGDWGRLTQSENSQFYKENGGAWCTMLEIYEASIPQWRIDFCEKETGTFDTVDRKYIRLETEEQARKWADAVCPPNCLPEVTAVANSAEQPKIHPQKTAER